MNYQSITENVVAAVLAAILLGVMAWLLSWIRNLLLERKLKEAITPSGIGVSFDERTRQASFTLQIHNYATATIRVRAIVLIADKFHVELRPAQGRLIYQTPLSNEIVRQTFKRKHLSRGSIEPDNNPNSMLLPPKTMGIWEAWPNDIASREWIIKDVYMVFEYATLFGNSALVRMRVSDATLRLIKENFGPLSRALRNKQPLQFHGPKLVTPGE